MLRVIKLANGKRGRGRPSNKKLHQAFYVLVISISHYTDKNTKSHFLKAIFTCHSLFPRFIQIKVSSPFVHYGIEINGSDGQKERRCTKICMQSALILCLLLLLLYLCFMDELEFIRCIFCLSLHIAYSRPLPAESTTPPVLFPSNSGLAPMMKTFHFDQEEEDPS